MTNVLLFPLALIVIVVAVAANVAMYKWSGTRGNAILEKWAAENGYRLVKAERRFLGRGPFWLTTNRSQEVYYITVGMPDGSVRHAFARCGGILGMLSDAIEVKWGDEDTLWMRSGYLNVANTCSLKIGTGIYSGASEAQANWANVSRWISVWRVGYAWSGNRRLS